MAKRRARPSLQYRYEHYDPRDVIWLYCGLQRRRGPVGGSPRPVIP